MRTTDADTLALLRRARARIADPEHWCQGQEALDADMQPVGPNDPAAVYWCALGALRAEFALVDREKFEQDGSGELDLLNEYAADYAESVDADYATGRPCLTEVNDLGSHTAVLAVYDAAIDVIAVCDAVIAELKSAC